MNFRGARILITGGTGFLGSFLSEEMLDQGAAITIYDKLLLGTNRIRHLMNQPSIEVIEGDMLDNRKLKAAVQGKDFIWHLAGNTDIPAGSKDTSLDLNDGIIATRNVLEVMRETGVRKLAFTSSGAIYGEKTTGFRTETDGPTLPISLYGAGKIAGEAILCAYAHLFDVQAWIFRLGNVVGARISHGVIRDFIRKLKKNPKELEVLGDGSQEKSYLLVEECIAGMLHVIQCTDRQDKKGFCEVYNLGAIDATSVLDIAKMVIEEMGLNGCRIKIKGGERGWPGDQTKIALDISRISALGWKPQHTSHEAARITIRRMLQQTEAF